MDYKDQIDPELRDTARQVPFNRRIIRVGNLYQSAVLKLMKIPGDVAAKTIEIEGYQDKKYKTEIFTPADAKGPMPALIYVHGGAFCYKAAAYHKNLACIYAAKAKCKVFFPDYHLAPEYPYPAGLEDVRSLYRYVSERAEELGIRKDMIGLAGDSAGATIAALICNEYEKENLIKPCLQMLVYPLTDADMETRSMKEYTDTPFWNSSNQRQMWEFYFGDRYNEVLKKSRSRCTAAFPRGFPILISKRQNLTACMTKGSCTVTDCKKQVQMLSIMTQKEPSTAMIWLLMRRS